MPEGPRHNHAQPAHPPRAKVVIAETLEPRTLLAVVTVNPDQVVRAVNPRVLGVNVNWWDTQLNTTRTRQMVQDAGLNFFRFPGGSSSNTEHFNNPPAYNGRGTAATFAQFIASVGGQGVVTLNYGTASPQEGAALLAYLNARPSDTTVIGMGPQWVGNDTGSWVQKDWRTAGYWASVRAASPVTPNDGLNFLRIGRPEPFGLHYFEVGNEMYGSWEVDRHGQGTEPGAPHDPVTYANFAKRFADLAAQIDPTISIGINSGSVSGENRWTERVLNAGEAIGFVPGFISDHQYMQAPLGGESDANLLRSSSNWVNRAAGYRLLLHNVLGAAAAANVELLATEFNSVYSDPGKQTTSLVNGLFVADTIGTLLQTAYNGANFWDLRNGWDTGNNNSPNLYGWRQGGDYGMLGSGSGPMPSTGTYVPYPTYFAHQLASKMIHAGDTVVSALSDDPLVSAYAVRQPSGALSLMVINKSPTTALTQQVRLQGFQPNAAARVWRYGKAEDTAQSQTADGSAALTTINDTLTLNAGGFSYTFPSYSMTVIEVNGVPTPSTVAARYAFYNNSAFDENDPAANVADNGAIAPDKVALRPGQTAGISNVTSFVRGINGVMIDLAGLPAVQAGALNADDFDLKFGEPAGWSDAPTPTVTVRPTGGTAGSARVTLTWPDNAIRNTWLRVTVKPGARTRLAQPDVFFFGNQVGETGEPPALSVTSADVASVRRHVSAGPVPITSAYDFDRDGAVTGADVLIARANLGRILAPYAAPAAPVVTMSNSATLHLRGPMRRSAWEAVPVV